MGEIFVKKNNAFERVVSDGNTVIINGGGGGGGGVTIAFHARQNESTNGSEYIPFSTSSYPIDGSMANPSVPAHLIHFRNLSKYLDVLDVNTNSLNNGVPFNSDNGVYTAKVAGVYRFTASATVGLNQAGISATNSSSFWMWLRKNPANPNIIANFDDDRVGSILFVARDDEQAAASIDIHHPSHTWEVELQAGDRIVLCAAWFKGDQAETTTNPPQGYRVWVGDAAFSGSYVGGASVTPRDPVAVYAHTASSLTPNNQSALRIRNAVLQPSGSAFTELIDPSSAFDPTTGIFTAPVTGIYKIGFSAIEHDREQGYNYYWIVKTAAGTTIADTFKGDVQPSAPFAPLNYYGTYVRESYYTSEENPTGGDWIVQLNVGDKITWHCSRHVTGEDGGGEDNTIYQIALSAHLLTSTQTVFSDGNPDVLFAFHTKNPDETAGGAGTVLFRTASASGTNYLLRTGGTGVMEFFGVGVEVADLTSSFDPATGKFTAPVSGWYELDGQVDWYTGGTGLGRMFIWMEKNNTTNIPLVNAGIAGDTDAPNHLINRRVEALSGNTAWTVSQNIKNIVYLSEGETVAMCINASIAPARPAVTHWSFSGKRILPVNSSSGIGAGTVYSDYSATENGWTRIAPGVIMQWGKETITNPADGANDKFVNMTFPKSFTSIPWNASVTAVLTDGESNINGQNYCGQAMNITATGMRVIANRTDAVSGINPLYLHWQAIGPG